MLVNVKLFSSLRVRKNVKWMLEKQNGKKGSSTFSLVPNAPPDFTAIGDTRIFSVVVELDDGVDGASAEVDAGEVSFAGVAAGSLLPSLRSFSIS